MKTRWVTRKELWFAEATLLVAVGLQILTWHANGDLSYGLHPLIIVSEAGLIVLLSIIGRHARLLGRTVYRTLSFVLLGLISAENISSIIIITHLLITPGNEVTGYNLLTSAIAIFLTNIIVFALWYWEIDSPGLTGKRWSRHDKDFQFLQQDMPGEFRDWQPQFSDYLYLSLTNAVNFAPADTRPLTSQAKALMGTQSLISVLTLALVVARSVSILGS
jgi:hypothetical protein